MAHCVNHLHFEVQDLAFDLNLPALSVASKIGVWQSETGIIDRFPSKEELIEARLIDQPSKEYFALKPAIRSAAENESELRTKNEIFASKKAKFRELGYTKPIKKEISNKTAINVLAAVSRANNELAKINAGYHFWFDYKQKGEALNDTFIWTLKKIKGNINLVAKKQRLEDTEYEKNTVPSFLLQDTRLAAEQAELSFERTAANYSQQIIRKMADVMKEQYGVDYSFITPEEARELTKTAKNPWVGQKSFFYNGKVWFIAGALTPSDVLHEYIHPVVRSLAKQNPVLFNSLYDQLKLTQDGREIINMVTNNEDYLVPGSDEFKEECLVRALEKKQDLNNKGLEVESAFESFLNNLLYAIKQFLRKVFGKKIAVSDLDVNTTLDELSDKLASGENFELDPEVITDRDLIMYKNEYLKELKNFVAKDANFEQIEQAANDYFTAAKKHLAWLQNTGNLGELANLMANEYKTGELQKMVQDLKSYQTKILQDSKQLDDKIELTRQRVIAILNTLGRTEKLVEKLADGLKDILKDVDNPDNAMRVLAFQRSLNYWNDVVNGAVNALEANGVSEIKMMDTIVAKVKRANTLVDDYYQKISRTFLWDKLKDSAAAIDKKNQDEIARLKSINAPAALIEKAENEAKVQHITPEVIEAALNGTLKDVSTTGSFLEGFSSSPDLVVGGLALAYKTAVTRYELKAQAGFNDMAKTVQPLLEQAGHNPNDPGKKGEELGQVEEVGYMDSQTGEFKTRKVWRFLNEFIGADIVRDKFLADIKAAGLKYQESRSDADKQALANLQFDWEQHRRQFFHGEFTEEYYKVFDMLKSDDIGKMARMEIRDIYDKMSLLSGQIRGASSDRILEITDQIEVHRKELRELSSTTDLVGKPKTGDAFDIAERIKAFNAEVQKLYDSVQIPKAFEEARIDFEQRLLDEGLTPNAPNGRYEEKLAAWDAVNTRRAIKDSFWEDFKLIMDRVKVILSSLPEHQAASLEIDKAYEVMKDLVRAHRDESGQPLGSEMTPEVQEKIRQAQEKIDEARENFYRLSGLSKDERDQIDALLAKMGMPGGKLTPEERLRLSNLFDKQSKLKLNKIARAELSSLYMELDDLKSSEATDSYVDTVNSLLLGMDQGIVRDILSGRLDIDKETAFLMGDEEIVEKLMAESKDFEEWFLRNHIIKERIDFATNAPYYQWKRTYAWNVLIPKGDEYYEHTTFKTLAGEEKIIQALPSLKYYKRVVKDEYKTKAVVGVTTTNQGYGHWLPKTVAQGAPDARYINPAYERMRTSDPKNFALLQALKNYHLKNQEGLENRLKLYMDYPRFPKQFTERAKSKDALGRVVQRIKDGWTDLKQKYEYGFNYDTSTELIKMDFFDDQVSGIPLNGISNMEFEEVSTEIVVTTMRFALAAERHKALSELAPMARIIQKVVNNEENHPLAERVLKNATIVQPGKKKQKYVRARAINNFIEKNFEGQKNTGWGADNAIAQNFAKNVFGVASAAYMNFNIPSAIKNALGMKFQGLIEALAGKYFTWKDYVGAEAVATRTAFTISKEIYEPGPKSLEFQMVEAFDPERDHFAHHYGESMTRTAAKDYSFLLLRRATDFRRWVQMQASLQTFFALMNHTVITTIDGKSMRYGDAFEVVNGKLQTKANVPADWAITYDQDGNQILGKKFIDKRHEIHRILDNLNGAMGQEDRPEADRYLLWKFISFFRRFITSMITNRFAYSGELTRGTARGRYDFQLGDTKKGWYIEFFQLLAETFRHAGKNLPYMNANQKAAALRMTGEISIIAIMKWVLLPLIFGWDPDDPDKFAKLRAKSDALPLPGVYDDPNREFDLGGWFSNHALLQMMQVAGENDQFLPFPGYGFDNYEDYLDIKSMAMGPTVSTMFNLVRDVGFMVTGDDRAVYARPIGPYDFQQEGHYKFWAHFAKIFGLSGSIMDPAKGTKGYWSIENAPPR